MDKTLKKIHARLPESLLVTTLVVFWSLAAWAVFLRFQALPELAEVLPAEHTQMVLTLDVEKYRESTAQPLPQGIAILGHTPESLPWLKHISWILLDQTWVFALDPSSKGEAVAFLKSLQRNKEEWESFGANRCYQLLPACFRWAHGHLWLAKDLATLDLALDTAGPRLQQTPAYQNVHSRLPLFADLFVYMDLQKMRLNWTHHMGLLGFAEPGYAESLLRMFPAYGLNGVFKNGLWELKAFTAIDKTILEDAGILSSKEKYWARYPALVVQPMAFEWGMQAPFKRKEDLLSLLSQLSPASTVAFNGALNEWIQNQSLGFLDAERAASFFQGEIYFGETVDGAFLLIAQIDPMAKESITASFGSLEQKSSLYEGSPYTSLQKDGLTIMNLALLEDKLILTSSKDLLFSVLDVFYKRVPQRDLSTLQLLLLGADEFGHRNLDFLSKWTILRNVQWTSKLFDDGMSTRMILTPL